MQKDIQHRMTTLEQIRVSIVIAAYIVYCLVFVLLYPIAGTSVGALAIFPVLVTGWYYGIKGGVLAGLSIFILNTFLFNLSDNYGLLAIVSAGGFTGTISLILVGAIFGYIRDIRLIREGLITELKRTTSERDSFINALPDSMFRVAPNGNILDYRPGYDAEIRLDPNRIIGKRYQEIILPDVAAEFSVLQQQVIDTKEPVTHIYDYTLFGNHCWFEARIYPTVNDETLFIIRDITAIREQQQQQVTLEAQDMRLEFLQQFIRSLSHDFQTPLSIIQTNTYLLPRLLTQPEKLQEKLDGIKSQTDRLNKLVKDILMISRLESDLNASSHKVDFGSLIQSAYSNIKHLAEQKQVSVQIELPENRLYVWANEISLHQAVSELIENAIQHSDLQSEVNLKLYSRAADERVCLSVQDFGSGISKEELPHIFDYFYRGDKSRSQETGGAGLGLTIARRVTELHHGQITVKSVDGQGSTFIMCLPELQSIADKARRIAAEQQA